MENTIKNNLSMFHTRNLELVLSTPNLDKMLGLKWRDSRITVGLLIWIFDD